MVDFLLKAAPYTQQYTNLRTAACPYGLSDSSKWLQRELVE